VLDCKVLTADIDEKAPPTDMMIRVGHAAGIRTAGLGLDMGPVHVESHL